MTGPELLRSNRPATRVDRAAVRVDLNRYAALHSEGRKLISGWFERAWKRRDCQPEDCFEPFIFAWFAVNTWAACVTEVDGDHAYQS